MQEIDRTEIPESAGDTILEKYPPEDIARVMDSVKSQEMETCRDAMSKEQERMKEIINAAMPDREVEIGKIATTFAKKTSVTLEEAVGEILRAIQNSVEWLKTALEKFIREPYELEQPIQHRTPGAETKQSRKEARERRQAVERATTARFRQYNVRETVRAVKKRTGPHGREWRGPYSEG